MDKYATRMILFMPPPLWSAGARGPNSTQWESNVRTSALSDSAHFAYAGGGYLLNPMIHAAEKTLSSQTEAEFEKLARDMAKSGVVGFGEIALLHLTPVGSQFIEIPNAGKNRLLLKLADVAAENNLPIDIHMEAVPKDMQTPSLYEKFDPANPDTLKENIKGFEALLSYNPKTRYVWAHAGWDNTGGRTVQLTERLLKDHPNLYLHLQLTNVTRLFPENNVLDTQGKIQATWSALFEKYPDRVMVGTDRFSSSESGRDNAVFTSGSQVQAFLKQLPGTVVNNIACRNAVELYHLKSSC